MFEDIIDTGIEIIDGARGIGDSPLVSKAREKLREYLKKEYIKQSAGPKTQKALKGLIVFPIGDIIIDQFDLDPGAKVRNAFGDRGFAMVGERAGGDILPPEAGPMAQDDGPHASGEDKMISGQIDP